jgi:hypothetical protein
VAIRSRDQRRPRVAPTALLPSSSQQVLAALCETLSPGDEACIALQRKPALNQVDKNTPVYGPPDKANACGVIILVQHAGAIRSVDRLPALDVGSGYVFSIESLPGEPVRIAAMPDRGATARGQPVEHAMAREQPHHLHPKAFGFDKHGAYWLGQVNGFLTPYRAVVVGGHFKYERDGTVTLGTKSGHYDGQTRRIGERGSPPLQSRKPALAADCINDKLALLEVARQIASATQQPVRIGEPVGEPLKPLVGTVVRP